MVVHLPPGHGSRETSTDERLADVCVGAPEPKHWGVEVLLLNQRVELPATQPMIIGPIEGKLTTILSNFTCIEEMEAGEDRKGLLDRRRNGRS